MSAPHLYSPDEEEFHQADEAARLLGLDTWDVHWRRLQEKPTEPSRWYCIMSLCDATRIGSVLAFAEQSLDLAAIATGVANELGLGKQFQLHSCLDFILQELRRFPGQGGRLIEAALKSPVVRNRRLATVAHADWPQAQWPVGIKDSLEQAALCEPDADLRQQMFKVLQREFLSMGVEKAEG